MAEYFAHFLSGIPTEAVIAIIGALPVVELRGAIPWALAMTDLSWQQALLWALIGNFIPIIPVLLFLDPFSKWLRKIKLFDRFFNWLFERTRRKGKKVIEKYEAIGLAIFVGIPLPGTGVWTGAVAAFIFGIPFRLAFPSIVIGMLMAGGIVILTCLGIVGIFKGIV